MDQSQILTTKTSDVQQFWKNKKVLITGGSAGLGKHLALLTSSYGAHVAVVARKKDRLDDLKILDSKIITVTGDVAEKEDIHKISGQVLGQLQGIDVLINNASYLGKTPLLQLIDTQCEDVVDILETNLLGPFRLIKTFLPGMLLQNHGIVVNISSDAATSAYPTWGGYGVSKAALDHLTKIWQEELHQEGIQFLALDPGDMHTQMHLDAIPDADITELFNPEDVVKQLLVFLAHKSFEKVRYSASEWRKTL